MSYITLTQLAEGPGMLAELAEPFGLTPALLKATLASADRSAWTLNECDDADHAVAAMQNTLNRVDAEIATYLVKRGYTLPVSASDYPVLTTWARAIARYHLQPQRDRTSEETGRIERDYRGTLQTLAQLAVGGVSLGANDPLVAAVSVGAPEFDAAPRVFTRDILRGI